MQASAMHSKACWILAPVFSVFLLCPLFGVDAEESPAGDTPQPIYEMNTKKTAHAGRGICYAVGGCLCQ